VHKSSFPLKETRSPTGDHAFMNKTIAVHSRSLHNIHKFGNSSYQETLHIRIFAEDLTSRDLHELHIRKPLKVSTAPSTSLNKDLLILILKTFLSGQHWERSLGACQLILISPTGITRIHKRIPARSPLPPIFWHWACNQTPGVWVVTHLTFRVPNHDLPPAWSYPATHNHRRPVLMHSPMWLNTFSFFNRILLFIRLSLIHGENLATRAQSTHS
jgi:hypothetical protein